MSRSVKRAVEVLSVVLSILLMVISTFAVILSTPVSAADTGDFQWSETFDDGANWTIIGDALEIANGRLKTKDYTSGGIGVGRQYSHIAKRPGGNATGEFNLTWDWTVTDCTEATGPQWHFGTIAHNITDCVDIDINGTYGRAYYKMENTSFSMSFRHINDGEVQDWVVWLPKADVIDVDWHWNIERFENSTGYYVDCRAWNETGAYDDPAVQHIFSTTQYKVDQIALFGHDTDSVTYEMYGWADNVTYETANLPVFDSSPETQCLKDLQYTYNVTCSPADSGTLAWNYSLPGWLSITDGGNGSRYMKLEGTPTTPGDYSVDLEVSDQNSTDYQNFTITVLNGGKLFPTDDSYIDQHGDSDDQNNGDAEVLWALWQQDLSYERRGLIKFDLSSIPSEIEYAHLYLYYQEDAYTNKGVDLTRVISVRNLLSDWTEGGVTWNNKPSRTEDPVANLTLETDYGWKKWDVTGWLQSIADGNISNYGVEVAIYERGDPWTGKKFSTSEGTYSPYLIYAESQSSPGPDFNSSPTTTAVTGTQYTYNATCTDPDLGTVGWNYSLPSWLSVAEGGNGSQYMKLQGTPSSAGSYQVNLSVSDENSTDYQNFTITVNPQGEWGTIHTFDSITDGTRDGSTIDFDNGDTIDLIDNSANDEMIVMNGELYYYAEDDNYGTVARYTPSPQESSWNISMELYPHQDNELYDALNSDCSRYEMQVKLLDGTAEEVAAKFTPGEPGEGYEDIEVYDGSSWTQVSSDIITTYPHRYSDSMAPDSSESIYGEKFDRYMLSFEHDGDNCTITIKKVVNSTVSVVHSQNISLSTSIDTPKVEFFVNTTHKTYSGYRVLNYWVIDNLGIRGNQSRLPYIEPRYEYIYEDSSAWLEVTDGSGSVITDATASINGSSATYNSETSRYETTIDSEVDWHQPFNYSVTVDGCSISGTVHITTMPTLDNLDMPLWWNGWDWVSVFGEDDCSGSTDAEGTYSAYNHPTTPYIQSSTPGGSSSDILDTQSEIAGHYPHDVGVMGYKQWSEAQTWASNSFLKDSYTYASKWDNPSYVGQGDTYLMMAYPGNWGNLQTGHALYDNGYRTAGRSTDTMSPQSKLLWSSWYHNPWNTESGHYYPYEPYQLMDIRRGPNTDNAIDNDWWQRTFNISETGGVLPVYNHGTITSSAETLLNWIDADKTNTTHENWKATNGELASYVYGRWTTDPTYNSSASEGNLTVYDVSRQDPISEGYWRVPVTLSFNLSGKSFNYVSVTEDGTTYNSSDGSLQNLTEARIMDLGYDIRNETLYVSHFWNDSATLTISAESETWPPTITTSPDTSAVVDESYSYDCDTNETSTFALDTEASFLSIDSDTGVVSGTPTSTGHYYVNITATSTVGQGTTYQNYTLTVESPPDDDTDDDDDDDYNPPTTDPDTGSGGGELDDSSWVKTGAGVAVIILILTVTVAGLKFGMKGRGRSGRRKR